MLKYVVYRPVGTAGLQGVKSRRRIWNGHWQALGDQKFIYNFGPITSREKPTFKTLTRT
jgi:hypothetical protein